MQNSSSAKSDELNFYCSRPHMYSSKRMKVASGDTQTEPQVSDLKRPHYSMENSGFHIEYDESDIYDHMYDPVYSDADDSSEDDFYENNDISGGKKNFKRGGV
ncbi:hypothetical protein L1887_37829 [Cichorium endivia]|nr:hypothetical protein L1887_37829 [Cichorium endivia]